MALAMWLNRRKPIRDLEKPLEGLHKAMEEDLGGKPSGTDQDFNGTESSLESCSQKEAAQTKGSGFSRNVQSFLLQSLEGQIL